MNKALLFAITFLIVLPACTQQNSATEQEPKQEQLPPTYDEEAKTENVYQENCDFVRFEDYKTSQTLDSISEEVDFSAFPIPQEYRELILEEIPKGVNLGGKYRLITKECGDYCYEHMVVNLAEGTVLDLLLMSNYGVEFYEDNLLIVANAKSLRPEDTTRIPNGVLESFFVVKETTIENICETNSKSMEDSLLPLPTVEQKTCETDTDCIPMPGCHVRSCINEAFVDVFPTKDFCPDWTNCSAAYEPEDCGCYRRQCVNLNEGDKGCFEDEAGE